MRQGRLTKHLLLCLAMNAQNFLLCFSLWSVSNPKYSDLWSGAIFLQNLSQQPLNWQSIQQNRDRLILCLRLVHLCRSIDLQNTWRTLSFQEDQLFILIQRKGQKLAQWDPILKLSCKNICPSSLRLSYVSLTQAFCPLGKVCLGQC
jgi:hypothetical protein